MIKITVKSTGWAADKPSETIYNVPETDAAFERLNRDGSKSDVTFGQLFEAYNNHKFAKKSESEFRPESFEQALYKKVIPKNIADRLISMKFEIV